MRRLIRQLTIWFRFVTFFFSLSTGQAPGHRPTPPSPTTYSMLAAGAQGIGIGLRGESGRAGDGEALSVGRAGWYCCRWESGQGDVGGSKDGQASRVH
jgi:hypothetical protein